MSDCLVALLRGINVGGRHKVPMADLRAVFRELGCARVETLIQSGNVVFTPAPGVDAAGVGGAGVGGAGVGGAGVGGAGAGGAGAGGTAGDAAGAAARIAEAIEARFGFPVPVVLREPGELVAAVEAFPFRGPEVQEKYTGIGFLAATPTAEAVASLDPNRSPGDVFQVIGRDVHLYFPRGSARSKLTVDWFQRRLGTTITVRNLRTMGKVIELCGQVQA